MRKIYDIFLIMLFYIFLFQIYLQDVIPLFQYTDELVPVMFFCFSFIKVIKTNKIDRESISILCLLLVFIFIGLLGNLFYYSRPLNALVQDIVTCSKFVLMIVTIIQLDIYYSLKAKKIITFSCKIITIIFLVLTIYNFIYPIFPVNEYRYGIPTQQLIFFHPTHYAAVLSYIIITILMNSKLNKKTLFYVIILSILTITTFRTKAIATVFVLWLLIMFKLLNFKIKKIHIILIGIIAVIFARDQINYYFDSEGFARTELLNTSIEIAQNNFPLGTGVSTFGSWSSGVYYSQVYIDYGISNVWGMTSTKYSFIADSFWPTILGQFGLLGLLLFCILLKRLYNFMIRHIAQIQQVYLVQYVFIFLLISSVAESSFFNPLAIHLAYAVVTFRKEY